MQSQGITKKSQFIQGSLVLFGTFGIIVPMSVWLLPVTGNFPPAQPLIPDSGQLIIRRPPKSQLSFYIRGLNELSRVEKRQLRPYQMSRLNSMITPWLQRVTMTDHEAFQLHQKLATVLTREQRMQMREWQMSLGSYSPPPLPNDWHGRAIQEFRDTYNPFCAPVKHRLFSVLPPEMRERYQMRYDERMALLKQWRDRAKGQEATP